MHPQRGVVFGVEARAEALERPVQDARGGGSVGGPSQAGNHGPLTIAHHRIKSHGDWQVPQPFPGIYVWRDPHGAHYLVDHTGTRRIPEPPPHTPRPRPLVLEIHHSPIQIDYDLTA